MSNSRRFGQRRSTSRRPASRNQIARALLVLGGNLTEPLYFEWIHGHLRGLVNVTIVRLGGKSPRDLLAEAKRLTAEDHDTSRMVGDRRDTFDLAWIATDVDELVQALFELARKVDPMATIDL